MSNRWPRLPIACMIVLLLLAGPSRGRGQEAGAGRTGEFDPRDLSGFWVGDPEPNDDAPPLTPAGRTLMEGRVPHTRDLSFESNDPIYTCDPQGFPRLVWDDNRPMEIIHLDDRILQLFERESRLRELWIDGRELPSGENLDNLGPAWYGHSVAHWEGDSLIVDTTGLYESAWLDAYGHPVGFDARMEERYTRTGPDTIEGQLTIHDPRNYTAAWEWTPVIFRRLSSDALTSFGWKGLDEGICAPLDADEFDRTIREPVVLGADN